MENIELFKTMKRYCKTNSCRECGFKYICVTQPDKMESEKVQIAIDYIEQWSEEHPIKTRQSEFLERYPNAPLNEQGVVDLLPCEIDKRLSDNGECTNCEYKNPIGLCVKTYWSEEIDND